MFLRRFQKAFTAVVLAALALAVGWPGSSPASAAGPATCRFTGMTTQLTWIPVLGPSSGTYVFNGTFDCVTGSGAHLNVPVTSAGTFRNIQCGTGTALGSVSVSGVGSFSYLIEFAGGQGLLTITSSGDLGRGVVSMLPQPGGCVTGPVQYFTIQGEVTGDIS